MAFATRISNAAAIAACDAIVDQLDAGAGAALIRIYDGTQPADPDTAITSQVLLAELTCSDPAFGSAVDGTGKATATASAITADSSANATGTATWFRAVTSTGTAVIDGTVGTSGTDMILNTTSISSGQNVAITSWTFSVDENES
jgi:hypothetical protein